MSEEYKLKQSIKEYFYTKLKEIYIDNEDYINGIKITEIKAVKVLFQQETIELSFPLEIKLTILFGGYHNVTKTTWTTKVFEFDCRIKIDYDEVEQKYVVEAMSNYFPRESSTLINTFT